MALACTVCGGCGRVWSAVVVELLLGWLCNWRNFARSLGPSKWSLTPVGGWAVPSSTSVGSCLLRLGGGWSNQACTTVSLPCPKAFLRCGAGLGGAELLLAWWASAAARRRSGSPLCMGHVCHGRWHGHSHRDTAQDLLHWLHQVLVSSEEKVKFDLVPETLCGHLGHRSMMTAGQMVGWFCWDAVCGGGWCCGG